MSGRLEGRVAVVTGGASGFGEATSKLFVAEGARVVVADLQRERGEKLVAGLGDAAAFARCDVTREDEIAAAVDLAVERFGRLDCLFANAGIVGAVGPIDEIPVEDFDTTVAVLLRGVFLCMKHAARVMKPRQHGSILATSSVAGLQGGLGPTVYAACKAGVIGLTRNAAAELGPQGIRVNCIAPGSMATPMIASLMGDPDAIERLESMLARSSPLKERAGLASDIAQAALWLASDDAGYVNGHTLTVDGGLTSGQLSDAAQIFAQSGPLIREAGRRGRGDD